MDERGTSSICPSCGSDETLKRDRMLKCLACGVEADRDALGVLNMGPAQGAPIPAGPLTADGAAPAPDVGRDEVEA